MLSRLYVIYSTIFLVVLILSRCGMTPDPRYLSHPERKQNSAERIQDLQEQEIEHSVHELPNPLHPSFMSSETFERFQAEIQRFFQAPYQWGGASPAGTDCSGLITTLYKRAADINLPHQTIKLYSLGRAIRARDLAFGDLVFFHFKGRHSPDHVGFYIGNQFFLHASTSRGVVLSKLNEKPYAHIFVGARRILE